MKLGSDTIKFSVAKLFTEIFLHLFTVCHKTYVQPILSTNEEDVT